jgi:hypothetical protein
MPSPSSTITPSSIPTNLVSTRNGYVCNPSH